MRLAPLGLVTQCRPQQKPDVGELPASSKGQTEGRGESAGLPLVGWLTLAY